MTEGTFEKVKHSDNPMYGPPKLRFVDSRLAPNRSS
jgi:hypothetical protein